MVDIKKDINFMLEDAERHVNRCDIKIVDVLSDLRIKIESFVGTDEYNEYLDKFNYIRNGFKIECLCGKKARMERELSKGEPEEQEESTSWFKSDIPRRLEEAMEFHRKHNRP